MCMHGHMHIVQSFGASHSILSVKCLFIDLLRVCVDVLGSNELKRFT